MTPLQAKIQETLNEIRNIQTVKSHYNTIVEQVESSYKELNHLNKVLTKEHADVEELEKLSVRGVFHKVLGSKEQQLDKERQEYLHASLKYNEHKKSIELLEYEKSILEKKLKDDKKLISQLEQLKKQRENEILRTNKTQATQLMDLSKLIDKHFVLKRDIREAVEQGIKCDEILNLIIHELKKASQWGQWDTYGRGGAMSSHMKHGAIDRAKNLSYQAKHKLVRFKKELSDLGVDAFNLDINIEEFGKFTDIFFDNLISDWIIQKKIQNSLRNIINIKQKVGQIKDSIAQESQVVTQKIDQLSKERDDILVS